MEWDVCHVASLLFHLPQSVGRGLYELLDEGRLRVETLLLCDAVRDVVAA